MEAYNKAIVAAIGGGVQVANAFFGADIGVGPETISMIAGALTVVIVWLVPNKA